jgi:hypothetical protein
VELAQWSCDERVDARLTFTRKKHSVRGGQQAPTMSLSDAILKAIRAVSILFVIPAKAGI